MGDYWDDYYEEPSEFDKQINEFKNSLIKAVKREHQEEIERLRAENQRLSAIEQEMMDKTRQLDRKIEDVERRKKDLKREAEEEFWKLTISDVLDKMVREVTVWYAGRVELQEEKCELCNDERKLVSTFPDGTEATKGCACAKPLYQYAPFMTHMCQLTVNKRNSLYLSDRSFFLTRKYIPSERERYDCSYGEFSISTVVDVFCEDTKKKYEESRYRDRAKIGFTSEAECQKFCDWLNAKKD